MRLIRAVAAMALLVAGALLHAASWQRWAGACAWPSGQETDACNVRQDHLYDFLVVAHPWQPVGTAAEQAGAALLLMALALLLAPWALVVRPSPWLAAALVVAALGYVGVGSATLSSGLSGEVVDPWMGGAMIILWLWVPTPVLAWAAVRAGGWARAAGWFLFLASPLVMGFSYAIGPFDANPWYEAYSGDLTALAGLCLLVAAARPLPARQSPASPGLSTGSGKPAGTATATSSTFWRRGTGYIRTTIRHVSKT